MAMRSGLSGYTGEYGSGFMKGRFRWVETYDIDTNTSNVTIYPQYKNTAWYGWTYYFNGSYTVDGTTVASMSSAQGGYGIYTSSMNTWLAPTKGPTSFTQKGIAHNADGTKSITIAFNSVRGYITSGGADSGWTINGSATIKLTNIPRGSSVSGTDANIGAASTLVVSKNVSNTTHSIKYAFGSLTGYVTAAGGVSATEVKFSNTTVNWTVPTAFYDQIPNASSGKCTLTITTYQASGAKLGSAKTASITVTTTAALSGPTVSGRVEDVNDVTTALTGDSAVLVRGCSTARASITATARNSASIRARSVNGTAVEGDGYVDYPGDTSGSFVFAATDSRGFSAQTTVSPAVVEYIPLTVVGSCLRTGPTENTAVLTLSGNWFSGSFGAADNTLAVRYRVDDGGDVDLETVRDGNTWSASVTLSELAYTNAYSITVTASDRLTSLTRTLTLNRGVPVFDWGEDDFRFNVPVGFPALSQTAKDVLRDFIYPVGSYYWSEKDTSPAALFGGEWTQVKDRFVLAAGSTYKAGATGGEATHKLTVSEMPSHTHSLREYWRICRDNLSDIQCADYAGSNAYGSTNATGGGKAHNNMPPYIAAYCWRRTA